MVQLEGTNVWTHFSASFWVKDAKKTLTDPNKAAAAVKVGLTWLFQKVPVWGGLLVFANSKTEVTALGNWDDTESDCWDFCMSADSCVSLCVYSNSSASQTPGPCMNKRWEENLRAEMSRRTVKLHPDDQPVRADVINATMLWNKDVCEVKAAELNIWPWKRCLWSYKRLLTLKINSGSWKNWQWHLSLRNINISATMK